MVLFLLTCAGLLSDVLTTSIALNSFDVKEANPIMRALMTIFGTQGALWGSHIALGGVGYWLYTKGYWQENAVMAVMFCAISIHNVIVIRRSAKK